MNNKSERGIDHGDGQFNDGLFKMATGSLAEREAFAEELLLVHSNEWRDFIVEIPLIIGYVPEEERRFFTTVSAELHSHDYVTFKSQSEEGNRLLSKVREGMPKTLEMIEKDFLLLGDTKLMLDSLMIETTFAKEGSAPRGNKPHIDPFAYLVSDQETTEFYQGRVRARYYNTDDELDLDSLKVNPRFFQAPPFAIVRKGPWAVHRSPRFSKDARRTFMTVSTSLALAA